MTEIRNITVFNYYTKCFSDKPTVTEERNLTESTINRQKFLLTSQLLKKQDKTLS